MKRAFAVVLAVGLVVGCVSLPAAAKKKKKAKPVATSLFLHGTDPAGEMQIQSTWMDGAWMKMDATEPTAAEPKSIFVTNYLTGPNTDCDGNGLLPVWRGDLAGTVKGDVTLTLHTISTPAVELVASLYADATGTCTAGATPATPASEAPPPVAQVTVAPAPGPGVTEITFEGVKMKSLANMIVQLHVPNASTPGQVRVLYDSADYASGIAFSCIPKSGKSCTP